MILITRTPALTKSRRPLRLFCNPYVKNLFQATLKTGNPQNPKSSGLGLRELRAYGHFLAA